MKTEGLKAQAGSQRAESFFAFSLFGLSVIGSQSVATIERFSRAASTKRSRQDAFPIKK